MSDVAVTEVGLEALQEQARGRVIGSFDEEYDEARAVHNGMFDKHPLAVLRAEQVADVIAGVNFARENGLDLSVRDGGHSAPGFGTNDGGLVIDMSPMRTVRVDPRNKTARADAGATWGDFNHATHAFGLATTGGIISTTGVTGLTLGGGIGYLARGCGLSIDNLISADVVTADGQFVTASERENEDLFWGLRGGGGNFGVVTSLEFRLHEVDQVFAGPIFYNLEDASSLFRMFDEFIRDAPEQFGGFPAFQIAPPLPFIPEDRHGDTLALAVVHWAGPLDAGGEGPATVPGCRAGRRQRDRAAAVPGAERRIRRPLSEGHPRLLEGCVRQRAARRRDRCARGARVPRPRGERDDAPVSDQRRVPSRRAATTRRSPTARRPTAWSSWPRGPTPRRTRSGSSGCATTTKRWPRTRSRADTSTSCRTTTTARSGTTTARTTIGWSGQAEVRPRQPLPHQPEHQAVAIAARTSWNSMPVQSRC